MVGAKLPGPCLPANDASPAVYTIVIRASEYDMPPDMLEDIVARSVLTFRQAEIRSIRDLPDDSCNDEGDF